LERNETTDAQLADAELAIRARKGDTRAFEVLVCRYHGAVHGLAYGWTRNVQEKGWGFLRPKAGSVSEKEDTYVSMRQINRLSLADGDRVTGLARPPKADESYWALVNVSGHFGS
jgi:transcription termination factor Rho